MIDSTSSHILKHYINDKKFSVREVIF